MSEPRSEKGQRPPMDPDDLLCWAWAIIANASEGDWTQQTDEWRTAATRWRDRWHDHIGSSAAQR